MKEETITITYPAKLIHKIIPLLEEVSDSLWDNREIRLGDYNLSIDVDKENKHIFIDAEGVL